MLRTINGGTSWSTLSSGTTNDLYSVYFTDPHTGYVTGEGGTILKTTNGGGFPVGLTDLASKPNTIKVYPNPSSTEITIETSSISSQNHLSIMSLSGQQLFNRQITESKTVIDISNLTSGVYILRLTNDKTVEVAKIIKH